MAGYVAVRLSSIRKVQWALLETKRGLATSGTVRSFDRQQINDLIEKALRPWRRSGELSLDIAELEVTAVRELRRISGLLSSRIHSARGLMIEDRRRLLSLVAVAKRELDPYLQLDLFSGA